MRVHPGVARPRRFRFASLNTTAREPVDGNALVVVVTLLCLRAYTGEHIQAQADPSIAFAYPALSGLLFAPFALLSRTAAAAGFTALCIASPLLSLRVLGVRDRRVYGLVLVWACVLTAWQTANLTLPLTLGMAVLWRYRDRPLVAGALTATLISLKPVVFPLVLWILVTRRFAAAGWGLLVRTAINAVAWSIVGFHLIGSYLHETRSVTTYFHALGYSAQTIAPALRAR